ncbi:MAG TPA: amine dehydrogenase large subunit [Methylophilaceae bacterium]|nr:amine dehydrogenase large subunit [Methylophilaceae bacterium]
MRLTGALFFFGIGLFTMYSGYAAEPFVPERMTVETKIRPGPNAFVLDQSWNGVSRINVLSTGDLSTKGNLSVGLLGEFTLTKDHKTAYTTSVYPKRIISGPTEAVLQEFDVESLTVKREIIILPKMAQASPQITMLQLSANERYAYVQNATPATSVTIVDLKAGKVLVEVPTPGCYGIYPALQGNRFSSLCGDGSLTTYTFSEKGVLANPIKSAKIFDAETDPLFMHGLRAEKDLLFTSFNGNLYRVSDATDTPHLLDKFAYTEGIEGGWAPGGVGVMAYNPAHKVLFVSMHPDAEEGSHKNAGKEVWAISLANKKVLYRSVVEGATSLGVTTGDKPMLFTVDVDNGVLTRYEVDPDAKFAAKFSAKVESMGKYAYLVWVDD